MINQPNLILSCNAQEILMEFDSLRKLYTAAAPWGRFTAGSPNVAGLVALINKPGFLARPRRPKQQRGPTTMGDFGGFVNTQAAGPQHVSGQLPKQFNKPVDMNGPRDSLPAPSNELHRIHRPRKRRGY